VQELGQLHQTLAALVTLLQSSLAAACQQQRGKEVDSRHKPQLQHLLQQLTGVCGQAGELLQQLSSPAGSSTAGRFEWVDGSLTTAIQRGTWVLLDNANLVNPTVLDRLNGLLEPGGVLQLDEAGGASSAAAGGGRVVVPHPGFRLILAYDPKHGEVSRAMRNRGVELFLLPPPPPAAAPAAAAAAATAAAGGATPGQLTSTDHEQVRCSGVATPGMHSGAARCPC
jgi:midasin